ncbi:nucleotidyltransferase domain-containing protein [Candidatus Pacearchaeota archaeon]|nr:nucleotidyltransferase domain-containing protein [Candidatus Pacearchaeota archaeon]
MLTKNQTEILNLFRRNIFLKISILQLAKKLKKSYQRMYESVKKLEKRKILKIEKLGNTNLISLILSRESILYLSLIDEQEAINSNLPNFNKLMEIKEISQYLILVAGSYAKAKQTKSSDLDLIIVIPNTEKAIEIQRLIENLTLTFHPKVHLFVFNNKDVLEMLLEKKENYGKEIFKNHIILKNAYVYYEILKEAVENGFQN